MRPLVGVDWGTSSLRAARFDAAGAVLEERASGRGILTVPAGGFAEVLRGFCGDWLQQPEVLCLVSGMAGSRQGWSEAPYCECPASPADLAAGLVWPEPDRVAIVPGLTCRRGEVPDVLRGEEVQVFGALALTGLDAGRFVLPGTHSKWVEVRAGRVDAFRTWMTGEMYGLLRQHSILARTMPADEPDLDAAAFERGVRLAAAGEGLLATAFSARTLALFDRLQAAALPSYLSGLVIGDELRGLGPDEPVLLVGNDRLTQRYALACRALQLPCRTLGEAATWAGHWQLARALANA